MTEGMLEASVICEVAAADAGDPAWPTHVVSSLTIRTKHSAAVSGREDSPLHSLILAAQPAPKMRQGFRCQQDAQQEMHGNG